MIIKENQMSPTHIKEMSKLVIGKSQKEIEEILSDYWENKIAIVWTVNDILEFSKEERSIYLTEGQAKLILKKIHKEHDSENGINWGTLHEALNSYDMNHKS
jgi:hypothetical protein